MNDIVHTENNGSGSKFHLAEVTKHLTEMEKVEAGISILRKELGGVVFDVTTTEGMAAAIAARARVRTPRIEVEKIRKAAKAPLNELGRDVDGRAKSITQQLEEIEDPIDAQIKAEQQRKETERLARVELERQRVETIRGAIDNITARVSDLIGASSDMIAGLRDILAVAELDPEFYQEYIDEAKAVHAKAIETLGEMFTKQEATEARERQILAEREELERLRAANAEREEREKQEREAAAAFAAQQAAEAAERRQAQERADRERREAEDAKAAAERARLAAEQAEQLKAQREQEEAARAERERIANEEAERRGREMAAAAEARQKEADRLAAEKAAFEAEKAAAAEADRLARLDSMTLLEAAGEALNLLENTYLSTDWQTKNLRAVLERSVVHAVPDAVESL